jgi:hypothetical protein
MQVVVGGLLTGTSCNIFLLRAHAQAPPGALPPVKAFGPNDRIHAKDSGTGVDYQDTGASFGFVVKAGRVGLDSLDDIVVSAINEPAGSTSNVGRAYAFEQGSDGFLSGDATRLTPATTHGINTANPKVTILVAPDHPGFAQWQGQQVRGNFGFWVDFISQITSATMGVPVTLKPSFRVFNTFMDNMGAGTGPQSGEIFARWIAVGNFVNTGKPEVVVSASGRDVAKGSVIKQFAGAAVHLKLQ